MPTVAHAGRRFTYADYLGWQGDERYELIDGVAYLMSPAPGLAHQEVAGEVYRQLANVLASGDCRPFVAPVDVRLPAGAEDDAVDTVVQPDVLVVCDPAKLDARGVRGAPDLVVEVLSPTSAFHDHRRKRDLYERAGVREYWLVDPFEQIIHIYRADAGGQYGKPEVREMKGETPVSTLPGVSLHWDELAERLAGLGSG